MLGQWQNQRCQENSSQHLSRHNFSQVDTGTVCLSHLFLQNMPGKIITVSVLEMAINLQKQLVCVCGHCTNGLLHCLRLSIANVGVCEGPISTWAIALVCLFNCHVVCTSSPASSSETMDYGWFTLHETWWIAIVGSCGLCSCIVNILIDWIVDTA